MKNINKMVNDYISQIKKVTEEIKAIQQDKMLSAEGIATKVQIKQQELKKLYLNEPQAIKDAISSANADATKRYMVGAPVGQLTEVTQIINAMGDKLSKQQIESMLSPEFKNSYIAVATLNKLLPIEKNIESTNNGEREINYLTGMSKIFSRIEDITNTEMNNVDNLNTAIGQEELNLSFFNSRYEDVVPQEGPTEGGE